MRRKFAVGAAVLSVVLIPSVGFTQGGDIRSNPSLNQLGGHSNRQNSIQDYPLSAEAILKSKFIEFQTAIPKFRSATDDFRWAIGTDAKRAKPLKNIENQTNVLLSYLSAAKFNHPDPNPIEFKDFSQDELAWETLNSAERIGAFLDFAVLAENQPATSVQSMNFLYKLDGELRRLKWLVSRVR